MLLLNWQSHFKLFCASLQNETLKFNELKNKITTRSIINADCREQNIFWTAEKKRIFDHKTKYV